MSRSFLNQPASARFSCAPSLDATYDDVETYLESGGREVDPVIHSYSLQSFEKQQNEMDDSAPAVLEEQRTDLDASFSEASLAAADSLALSPESEIYVEHSLPSDRVVGKKKKTRRNGVILCFSSFLLIGIIVLSVMLTKSNKVPARDIAVDVASTTVSIDSVEESTKVDNIFSTEPEPLPDIYFLLQAKVYNPAALLDMDTPEGKAFNILVEEAKTKNTAVSRSIDDLNLQRYALLVLYFGADGGAWTSTTGWSTPSGACEAWHGVTCQNSLVTGIDLGKIIICHD